MNKSNDDAKTNSAIVEIELNSVESQSAQHGAANIVKDSKEKPSGFDATDQGCVSCGPKDSGQNTENISLSSSSSDDETEQEISLDMNKKSSNIGYKSLMDIALLTANANQLRFLITYNSDEKTFFISATLIILSLFVQVAVGMGLIYKRHMKKKGNKSKADKVGSLIISGIFCLAVLNVLVVSFTSTSVN